MSRFPTPNLRSLMEHLQPLLCTRALQGGCWLQPALVPTLVLALEDKVKVDKVDQEAQGEMEPWEVQAETEAWEAPEAT